MEPVVSTRGVGQRGESAGRHGRGGAGVSIVARSLMLLAMVHGLTGLGESQTIARGEKGKPAAGKADPGDRLIPGAASKDAKAGPAATGKDVKSEPVATTAGGNPADSSRFRVRDQSGELVVARMYGRSKDGTALLLPDGQIGYCEKMIPTDEPFVPLSTDQIRNRLERTDYPDYRVLTTSHYVIFYQSREPFARDSAKLLEDIYDGLMDACRRHGFPVHDSEFPLVAVIFATEEDFRRHKHVAPEVQAYYEFYPNRIFFYEKSVRDRNEPQLTMLRKPQTVAHEGVHQILANIGVQPRKADWPLWLIEGFAEYCATPTPTRKGAVWNHLGSINALHMATLRELDDPLSNQVSGGDDPSAGPGRASRMIDIESLVTKSQLTPTDYAQAWALTHYLAQRRYNDFLPYLKAMSAMPPLVPWTPEQHLAEFRKYFGNDLARLDKKVEEHIRKLSLKRGLELPYYAVIFEQPMGQGMVRRGAMISQSPQVIERWVEQFTAPQGGMPAWQAWKFPTRARAVLAAEEWMRAN